MEPSGDFLIQRIILLIPLWLSLSVHEWAHARAAKFLGDDTAERQGRLTLNPLAHIDPIGTFLLPLMGVPFGWARPVPVNPMQFTHKYSLRTSVIIVSAAGPLSNFLLATLATVCFTLLAVTEPAWLASFTLCLPILVMVVLLNVLLGLFNTLPIPPLDGSRIVDALMPNKFRPLWNQFCRKSVFALLAVLIVPRLLGVSLFAWPMKMVYQLLAWLAGLGG